MGQHNRTVPPAHTEAGEAPGARPRGRVPAFVGVIAAAALIALSIGVFTLFGTRSGAAGSRVTRTPPVACAPSQATANLPAHTRLTAIAPLGTNDGWAVGRVWDPKSTTPPATLMLRLQNCQWARVGTSIPAAELLDIAMATPDDGWAVGATLTRDPLPGPNGQPRNDWLDDKLLVLHYTGGVWQQVAATPDMRGGVEQVKMISGDEGWMLLDQGKRMTMVNSTTAVPSFSYSLLHYQHGTWTNVPLGFFKPSMELWALDARQPGDVWLVGGDTTSGEALAAHCAGGAWTAYRGAAIGADMDQLLSVTAVSPTDVWAGGHNLYHFDGSHWSKASIQGTNSGAAGNLGFRQIVMLSPSEGWAFPDTTDSRMSHVAQGTTASAVRFESGVWQWTTVPVHGATAALTLAGFAPTSATQGWALGNHLVFTDTGETPETQLLYYDGGTWGVVR